MHDIVKDYGGIMAAVMSGVGSLLTIFITYWINQQKTERRQLVNAIGRLAQNLDELKKSVSQEIRESGREMHELKSHLNISAERAEGIRSESRRLEGRIDSQQNMIHDFTKTISTVSAQLRAVVTLMDATERRAKAADILTTD